MRMARAGRSYADILHHYYAGVHLVDLSMLDFFREEESAPGPSADTQMVGLRFTAASSALSEAVRSILAAACHFARAPAVLPCAASA